MNPHLPSWVCMVGLLVVSLAGAGCEQKRAEEHAEAVAAATEQLPASNEVFVLLDKKDYEGAIGSLLRQRQEVQTPEQHTHYVTLVDEVKIRLLDEAPNEPKAAEALAALRRITGGR